jgi:hypothetical protein
MKRYAWGVAGLWLTACLLLLIGCGGEPETKPEKLPPMEEPPVRIEEPAEPVPAAPAFDLPEGFPRDIPLYRGAEHVRSEVLADSIPSVWMDTPDSVETVAAFYQQALTDAGWIDRGGMENPSGGKVMNFRREEERLTVQLTKKPDFTRIRLSIATVEQ